MDRARGKLPAQGLHSLRYRAEEKRRGGGGGKGVRRRGRETEEEVVLRMEASEGFEVLVQGLNESMGMCLPVR